MGTHIEIEAFQIERTDAPPQFSLVLPFRFVQALVENDRSWHNPINMGEIQKLAQSYADLHRPMLPTIEIVIKGDPLINPISTAESKLIILKFDPNAETILLSGRKLWHALEIAKLEYKAPIGDIPISITFVRDLKNVEKLRFYLPEVLKSKGNYTSFAERKSLANAALKHFTKFSGLIEMNKASLASRSRCLFTFTAIANAASHFVNDVATGNIEEDAKLVAEFLGKLSEVIEIWDEVQKGTEKAAVARDQYIHSNAGGLTAIAIVANSWLKQGDTWKSKIQNLKKIDWSKSNTDLWEGNILVNGVMSKKREAIGLAAERIMKAIANK